MGSETTGKEISLITDIGSRNITAETVSFVAVVLNLVGYNRMSERSCIGHGKQTVNSFWDPGNVKDFTTGDK